MGEFKEIEGDLIKMALAGDFEVIAHGTNCFCAQKSGLAPQMVKTFGTDEFHREKTCFRGDMNKLGTIDYETLYKPKKFGKVWGKNYYKEDYEDDSLIVINAYTQYTPGPDARMNALELCLEKINENFKGLHIGLPLIGCGLGGLIYDNTKTTMLNQVIAYRKGHTSDVKTMIKTVLNDCDVTIVHYKP